MLNKVTHVLSIYYFLLKPVGDGFYKKHKKKFLVHTPPIHSFTPAWLIVVVSLEKKKTGRFLLKKK